MNFKIFEEYLRDSNNWQTFQLCWKVLKMFRSTNFTNVWKIKINWKVKRNWQCNVWFFSYFYLFRLHVPSPAHRPSRSVFSLIFSKTCLNISHLRKTTTAGTQHKPKSHTRAIGFKPTKQPNRLYVCLCAL